MADEKLIHDGGSCGSKGKAGGGHGGRYNSRGKPIPEGGTEDTPTLWDILKKVKYMQLDLQAVKVQTEHMILEAESLETDILECIEPFDTAEPVA